MKKAFMVLLVLAALAVAGVVFLLGSLNGIVKNQIEVVGSELLGVPVTVSSVNIDLKSGAGEISGLRIRNPDGYQARNAFNMNVLRVGIDLGTLNKQPLVINEITIDSPQVNLEATAEGKNNLQELLDNIQKNTRRADDKAAEEQESGEPMLIAIKKLMITGVTFSADLPTQNEGPKSGTLPTISKNNIGGTQGATPGKAGQVVISELTEAILKQAMEKKVMEIVNEKTKGALEGLGNMLNKSRGDE